MNVGEAKTHLSELLARVEAGFSVEIARDGTPIARLAPIDADKRPGTRFIAAHGTDADSIGIVDDFKLTE